MDVLEQVLIAFAFRVTFGIAAAMWMTPAGWVPAGFFRIHLWVLLGLNTLAAAITWTAHTASSGTQSPTWIFTLALLLALLSYIGSVVWLYERPRLGKALLATEVLVAVGAGFLVEVSRPGGWLLGLGQLAEILSSGALLGSLLTAMLLGHYYLNWPGMKLEPLQRLLVGLLWAVAARGIVSAIGLAFHQQMLSDVNAVVGGLLGLRWLAGIIGPAVTGRMAQLTLRIPNTQSATGILYAGTIMALLGELVAELLAPPGKIPL